MTQQLGRAIGLALAVGSVVTLAYTVSAKWYVVEEAALVNLPRITHRVDDHDQKFDQVGDAIAALADANLVGKAKAKARRAECMKFVKQGKLKEADCPEVEE